MSVKLILANSKHLYDVYVEHHTSRNAFIQVEANNRNHAVRRAEKAGYKVRDVNMVG